MLCAGIAETGAASQRVRIAAVARLDCAGRPADRHTRYHVARVMTRKSAADAGSGSAGSGRSAGSSRVGAGRRRAQILAGCGASAARSCLGRDNSHLPAAVGATQRLLAARLCRSGKAADPPYARRSPTSHRAAQLGLPSFPTSLPQRAVEPGEDQLPYLRNWPEKFDYLFDRRRGGHSATSDLPRDRLRTVGRTGAATLFGILPPPALGDGVPKPDPAG